MSTKVESRTMRDLFWLGVSIMSTDKVSVHGSWASRWVFILAATGSAVGLGSIWKFPYMVGAYGGGAFEKLWRQAAASTSGPAIRCSAAIKLVPM